MGNAELVIEIKAELGRIKSQLNQVSSEMKRSTEGIRNAFSNIRKELKGAILDVGKYAAGFWGVYTAIKGIQGGLSKLMQIHDEYKTLLAGTAATLTSLTKMPSGAKAGEVFQSWYSYLQRVYQKLTDIDAQILGTRDQAMEMLQVFAQHGVMIDINNKKQMEGLRNLMNAVMTITAGQDQEIQLRQEINALLEGENKETNRLFRLLQAIDPEIEQHIKLWKEQGTLIENVGKLLEGFDPAASLLENTFEAQKTTLSSIVKDILRGGFEPFFENAIKSMQKTIGYLRQHKRELIDLIKNGLEKAKSVWNWIKDTVKLIWNNSSGLKTVWEIIYSVVKKIFVVLAYLVGSTLPGIIRIFSNWLNTAKSIYYYLQAAGWALIGQFDKAKQAFEEANKAIKKAFEDPLGIRAAQKGYENTKKMLKDLLNLQNKFNREEEGETGGEKPNQKEPGLPYSLKSPVDSKAKKEFEALAQKWESTKKKLEMEIKTTGLDNYKKKLIELQAQYEELKTKFRKIPGAVKIIDKWYEVKLKYLKQSEIENLAKKWEDVRKRLEMEIKTTGLDNYHQKLLKLQNQYKELKEEFSKIPEANKVIDEWYKVKVEALVQEHQRAQSLLKINDQIKDIELKALLTEENRYQTVCKLIPLYEQIKQNIQDQLSHLQPYSEEWLKLKDNLRDAQQKLYELKKEQRELSDDFWGGFIAGLKELGNKMKSTFQKGKELAQDLAQALQDAFSTFAMDMFEGKLKSLNDYLKSFLRDIYSALVKYFMQVYVIQNLMKAASGWFSNLFGGSGILHEGGLVYHLGGLVKKFHYGGLAPDEVPAILQRGEYVISRKGVEFLDRINQAKLPLGNVNVAVNVVNETGIPVDAEHKGARFDGEKYIVDVVLKNIYHYGPLRHAIAGIK